MPIKKHKYNHNLIFILLLNSYYISKIIKARCLPDEAGICTLFFDCKRMTGYVVSHKVEECIDVCCILPHDNSTGKRSNQYFHEIRLMQQLLISTGIEPRKNPFESFGILLL